jgi:hypothetical protein
MNGAGVEPQTTGADCYFNTFKFTLAGSKPPYILGIMHSRSPWILLNGILKDFNYFAIKEQKPLQ